MIFREERATERATETGNAAAPGNTGEVHPLGCNDEEDRSQGVAVRWNAGSGSTRNEEVKPQ